MIFESYYWKLPLIESAQRIKELVQAKNEITEQELVQLEKDIFIGFYSIRKLLEAPGKITDLARAKTVELNCHTNLSQVDWLNSHKLDRIYNITNSNQETHPILFVCGRIIHSFVFAPVISDIGVLEAIAFTSDIDKNKKLYKISAVAVPELFELFGNDDVVRLVSFRDPNTGEMKVSGAF
ncbi:MAG: hypothetical protein KDJ99_30320 [Candidatus Competibacteraceae bacterium]|nr:hypothetical protein [Candidatus Competibacteraceae bacterium]